MANYENIKDANAKRTPEERRELAIRAGKASGKARRRKAALRDTMNKLMTMQVEVPELSDVLRADGGKSTYEEVVAMAIIQKAMLGDVSAFNAIKETIGQTNKSEADLVEQQARIDLLNVQKEKIAPVVQEEEAVEAIDPHDIIIPEFWEVFDDDEHEHQIITSGRAGTKSSFAGILGIWTITQEDPAAVVVLRKRHNKLRKTVYKEMIRAIGRLGMSKDEFEIGLSPMQIRYKKNGNIIYFSGSDSIDDTKGIIDEDKPIVLVVLDELTEFFDVGAGEDELTNIEATFVRGNDRFFRMVYLYNPPKNPNAAINVWCKKMESRSDAIHKHVDYRDVPIHWIGKKLIESAELLKKVDYKLYRWVWLGECIGVDDLIYYMFKSKLHVYDPIDYSKEARQSIGEIGVGVDYGQQNATVFEAAGIDYDAQVFRGLKEYYHSGRESGKQKSPSDYAMDLKQFCDELEKEYDRVVSYIFIDPSAAGLIEEVRRVLPHVTICKAKNDVKLGIGRVQKFLSFNKLLISAEQKMLIKEMGLYQYDPKSIENGQEVPIKTNDHCQDALRYLIVGMWRYVANMLPFSERGEKE